jgi:multisubunit Na+/H+ antiporter MnhF subunit
MTRRGKFFAQAVAVALLAFVAAAAFSAYLKPGMLVEFANLVLCS